MRRCLLATFISVSLCFAALPSAASDKVDKADKEQELRALKTKITQLQKNIGVKQDNKSAYVKQLKKIETSIGRVSQKISISNKEISHKKLKLKQLQKEKEKSHKQLSQENSSLAQQVYSLFLYSQ